MCKMVKCKMTKSTFFTLRMWYPVFGLRIGSRGTPWNSKSAQPGGSDFAKCQKVPFKWHFGLFRVLSLFHYFSCFAFCDFVNFDDFDFVDFLTFWVFRFFLFFCFVDFCQFLINFCCWVDFWSFFDTKLCASMMTHFFSSEPALPLSPLLVVKLWPIFDM